MDHEDQQELHNQQEAEKVEAAEEHRERTTKVEETVEQTSQVPTENQPESALQTDQPDQPMPRESDSSDDAA